MTQVPPIFDLHIAFGVDANYLPAMGAAIASIVRANPNLKLAFHVMATGFSEADKEKLAAFTRDRGLLITLHNTDETRLSNLPDPAANTRATYNRFLLCEVLSGVADKVVYLDADIICLGSLAELAMLDMRGKIIAAVPDADQEARKAGAGISGDDLYFNAGVLCIDIEKWNARSVTAELIEALEKNRGKFPMYDQDALNVVLRGEILFLDRKWNALFDHRPPVDTIFLHFAGGKPWQAWSPTFNDPRFVAALAGTPWAGWLPAPQSRKHKNKYAQHLLGSGCVLRALYWYYSFLRTPRKCRKDAA